MAETTKKTGTKKTGTTKKKASRKKAATRKKSAPKAAPQAAAREAKAEAAEAVADVREKLGEAAEERRADAARQAAHLADALEEAAEDLDSDATRGTAEKVAALARRSADYLSQNDLPDVIDDLETTARRHPALFVAGGLLLGLALGRFLRASDAGSAPGGRSTGSRRSRSRSGGALGAVGDFFYDRPLVVCAAVLGGGLIAGLSVPASRWESERFGAVSERFKSTAGELARETARNLAERGVQAAGEAASERPVAVEEED